MSAAMIYEVPTVSVEDRLRAAVAALSPAFRKDFRWALYEADRQILHGRTWSLKWNGYKAVLM